MSTNIAGAEAPASAAVSPAATAPCETWGIADFIRADGCCFNTALRICRGSGIAMKVGHHWVLDAAAARELIAARQTIRRLDGRMTRHRRPAEA